jgi:Holliday junction resolvase RusA-like endonuclease
VFAVGLDLREVHADDETPTHGRTLLDIFVSGRPVTKGSLAPILGKNGRYHGMKEDHADSKPWRKRVVNVIRQAGPREPFDGAVDIYLVFRLERRVSVRGGWVPSHQAAHPQTRDTGDADKLERNILDALQDARVITDDCRVTDLSSRKRWAREINGVPLPGVQILVREVLD